MLAAGIPQMLWIISAGVRNHTAEGGLDQERKGMVDCAWRRVMDGIRGARCQAVVVDSNRDGIADKKWRDRSDRLLNGRFFRG